MQAVQKNDDLLSEGFLIENISSGPDDRLLNTDAVMEQKLNHSLSTITFRRMWRRGEMPHPIKLGGQNFWWGSSIDKALKLKAEQAAREAVRKQQEADKKSGGQ